MHERNSIGAAQQTRAALKGLISLARKSEVNGRPALEDHGIRQKLAEIEGYVKAHQYSGYRQLTKDAKGEDAGLITMMMKLFSTEIGHKSSALSMELLAEEGLLSAGNAELGIQAKDSQGWIGRYMYSLGIAVAGGTANIQRNVIAERGLGLPRDAAANRSSGK